MNQSEAFNTSEKNIKENFEAIDLALTQIKKLKTPSGQISCPKCGNDLYFSVAKSNGHIWGKCKTEQCISWMM